MDINSTSQNAVEKEAVLGVNKFANLNQIQAF